MKMKLSSLLPAVFLFTGGEALKHSDISRYQRRTEVKNYHDEFGWVSSDDLMDHLHTLSKATGVKSPYKVPGYSPLIANKFRGHVIQKAPELVNHLVNMGHHYAGSEPSRKLSGADRVPDVAGQLRGAHERRMKQIGEVSSFVRMLEATPIETCTFDQNVSFSGCMHYPCTKEYLVDPEDETSPYFPFSPAYGGSFGYDAAIATIRNTDFWTGDIADRTDTDGYAANYLARTAASIAQEISSAVCDGLDDDIDVCILCVIFEFPNPAKIICEIFDGVLQIAVLILQSFEEQMDYQDGLVQGAEIEASFEHTRNLLHKQCAIYDEALCRCSNSLKEEGYGLGCDGKDSDCDDVIDECDEDKVLPVIDIDIALERCGGFFDDLPSAEECVLESVTATDDCSDVIISVDSSGDCDNAEVVVTATEVTCGKSTTATVPVFVDSTPPVPTCNFADMEMKITGPRIPRDVGFVYGATDNCGKPMQVKVDVYASEIEDFNAQEMALFFENGNADDAAKLYLAAHTCSTAQNGQCIKDPAAQDARLYTAIVTASDIAGNSDEVECQIKVIPRGNTKKKAISTEASTQRFHLTSYSSTFAGATSS